MIKLKTLIKEALNIQFLENLRGVSGGQKDFTLIAYDADTDNSIVLGYIDYSLFEGIVQVEYIKTHARFRRQGVASALVKELIRKYGKDKIEWGLTTDDGDKLFRALGITDYPKGYDDLKDE